MFKTKITKEEIAELPGVAFKGEIVVVDSEEKLAEASSYLSGFPVLGFDTESRAVFKKGIKNKISLLQLCAGDRTYLFRLNKIKLNPEMVEILHSPDIIKVGVAVRDDVRELQGAVKFEPGGYVDLQSMVEEWGIEDKSLQKITAIILEGRLSKAQRLSNWNAAALTDAQLVYAATDAWVCLEIHKKLSQTKKPRRNKLINEIKNAKKE